MENKLLFNIAAASVFIAIGTYVFSKDERSATPKQVQEQVHDREVVVLLGDVGGTNIRLTLRRLNLTTRESVEVKAYQKFLSQETESISHAVTKYLEDVKGTANYPKLGVVGIAGDVNANTVKTTNVPHWPIADGNVIAAANDLESFTFINDFAAAGYGICLLNKPDVIKLDLVQPEVGAPKVVMGPGTGLGEGYLTKSVFSQCYEIHSCEGGHTDFAVTSEEDWKLRQFALEYIPNSNNIENERGKDKIERVSVERLCAGPAVPLIYEFMKTQYPDLPRVLEENKSPDELLSHDIIACGIQQHDELCMKVVKKICEIFAVEVGNMALKTLPYGGLYLLGGVTSGVLQYIEHDPYFIETVYKKGRLSHAVRRVPIFVVKPEIELGILGTEECAFRKLGCYSK